MLQVVPLLRGIKNDEAYRDAVAGLALLGHKMAADVTAPERLYNKNQTNHSREWQAVLDQLPASMLPRNSTDLLRQASSSA